MARIPDRRSAMLSISQATCFLALIASVAIFAPGCGGDAAPEGQPQASSAPPQPQASTAQAAPQPPAKNLNEFMKQRNAQRQASAQPQGAATPVAPTAAAAPGAPPSLPGAVPALPGAAGQPPIPGAAPALPVASGQAGLPGAMPAGLMGRLPLPGMAAMGGAANFGSWKDDDYLAARAAGNPVLIEAVKYLGPARKSSARAADLLEQLLVFVPAQPAADAAAATPPATTPSAAAASAPGAPPALPPPDTQLASAEVAQAPPPPAGTPPAAQPGNIPRGMSLGGARQLGTPPQPAAVPPGVVPPVVAPTPVPTGPLDERALAEAIVEALGQNTTDNAREVLLRLVKGELPARVPDDVTTELAIKALAARTGEEDARIVIDAATNAAALRANAGGQGVTPDRLQTLARAQLGSVATPAMRDKLVEVALASGTSSEQRGALVEMVSEPKVENAAAQARLYTSDKIDDAQKQSLERNFGIYSAGATDALLRMPPGTVQMPLNQQPLELTPESVNLVAERLWTDDVVRVVRRKAADIEKIGDFGAINFAVAAPKHEVRVLLGELQRKFWNDGAQSLDMGTRYGDTIHDPGVLVLVKRTPRKWDPALIAERRGQPPAPAPGAAPEPARRRSTPQPRKTEVTEDEKIRYTWMTLTEEFVDSLNDRFYKAATAGTPASDAGPAQASSRGPRAILVSQAPAADGAAKKPGARPIEFYEEGGYEILAEYTLNWPADLPPELARASVTPMRIYYARLSQSAPLLKLNSHYRAVGPGVQSHIRKDGLWIDSLGAGTEPGFARTVDVVIRTAGTPQLDERTGRLVTNAPQDYLIDILSIEIPDPKPEPNDKTAAEK